ncbi:hypothetical protein A6K76_10530 [Caryophanon latum]|uniref:Uncharacterized protein n=1 Tax=Caryophanon latum TaxID=33977 RepID=A0A1C0YV12_9BACL|nr:hypothetical protein A6K76_10530 [Caryophanon latum]
MLLVVEKLTLAESMPHNEEQPKVRVKSQNSVKNISIFTSIVRPLVLIFIDMLYNDIGNKNQFIINA